MDTLLHSQTEYMPSKTYIPPLHSGATVVPEWQHPQASVGFVPA